jgi:hypothetical protein
MGYITSSAVTIPSKGFDYFVFFLNDEYTNNLRSEFEENFWPLAKNVGEKTLVVNGFDRIRFSEQVFEIYQIKTRSVPALLITDTPPVIVEKLPPNERNIKMVYIPLETIYKNQGSIVSLFKHVAESLKNSDALELINSRNPVEIEKRWGWLRFFSIKPNICGFGVDMNQFLEETIFKN